MHQLSKKKNETKSNTKREGIAYGLIIYYCLAGVSAMLALLFFFLAFCQYEIQPVRGGIFAGNASLMTSDWIKVSFSLAGLLALAMAAGFVLAARHSCFRGNNNLALDEENQGLQKTLLQKQDKLQEIFELRLIRGEKISDEEYEEYVKGFGQASYKFFSVLSAVLDVDENVTSIVDEEEICREILRKIPDQLKKMACLPPVCNCSTMTAVFVGDDEEALKEQVGNYYEGFAKLAEEVCGCQVIAGASSVHVKDDDIFTAYRESISVLADTTMGSGKMPSLLDIPGCHIYQPTLDFSAVSYDSSYEEEIRAGLRTMEEERCVKALEDFTRHLLQENRRNQIIVYIMRFTEIILFAAMEVNVDLEVLYPNGMEKIFIDLLGMPDSGRIKRYLLNYLINPILEARNQLLEEKSYSMLENIERLIRSKKGDISLTECAEILGVHPTYIWKVTKAKKGQTFSDYLEIYKLEEAKRLLLETDLTVAEIAAELNYTNAQNFIRFFNKSTGLTPGKYRKQN